VKKCHCQAYITASVQSEQTEA